MCLKCGYEDKSFSNENKICKRCGSNDMVKYFSKIKLYYKCENCRKYFKIPELSAKELFLSHSSNPECSYCSSKLTVSTLKRNYKKSSGQLQKKHKTVLKTLNNIE